MLNDSIEIWKGKFSAFWNSFRIAAWLGWQIESNWTDPFLFAVYSIIKPIAGAAILVVMYAVITGSNFDDPLFSYIYLGNAFYIYVAQILNGIVNAIIDDREHYKTLKYIYTAPIHFPTYLLGRSVANFIISSIAVFITLVVGVVFLGVPLHLSTIDWPLFIVAMLIGVNMLALMGLVVAGMLLLLVNHMWELGTAVAGSLFIFSGAVFPLEVLPPFLRWIGYLNPITYWLEILRRAMIGEIAQAFPTLTSLSDGQILLILIVLTSIFAVIAFRSFWRFEKIARDRGVIDVVTNY
jgi:ABC-2 type transport system permease protein